MMALEQRLQPIMPSLNKVCCSFMPASPAACWFHSSIGNDASRWDLDTVARFGRAIRVSSGSSDITAACDDDGATVWQIRYLVLHFPNHLSCTSNADIASVVVIWIPATDHPVAGCSESCFTFHCLMKSTASRYCSTYVFFVLNIFKISIQNCPFSFTRYTVFQSHARPISVSHTSTIYSNSVSYISFSLKCSTVVILVLSSLILSILISNVAARLAVGLRLTILTALLQ